MVTKAKTVKLKDLAAATSASVKAALGKEFPLPARPGTLAGFIAKDAELTRVGSPMDLAKEIAKGVSTLSGIRVKPEIAKFPGGVLVGYIVPRVRKQ